jgi:hypothetical protein
VEHVPRVRASRPARIATALRDPLDERDEVRVTRHSYSRKSRSCADSLVRESGRAARDGPCKVAPENGAPWVGKREGTQHVARVVHSESATVGSWLASK